MSKKAPPYSAGDWVTRLSDKALGDRHRDLLLGDRQWAVLTSNPAGNLSSVATLRLTCGTELRWVLLRTSIPAEADFKNTFGGHKTTEQTKVLS